MLITIRSLKERRFARLKERRSFAKDEVKERQKEVARGGMVQGKNEMRFACVRGLPSVISII